MRVALYVLGTIVGIPITLLIIASLAAVLIFAWVVHTWDEGEGK